MHPASPDIYPVRGRSARANIGRTWNFGYILRDPSGGAGERSKKQFRSLRCLFSGRAGRRRRCMPTKQRNTGLLVLLGVTSCVSAGCLQIFGDLIPICKPKLNPVSLISVDIVFLLWDPRECTVNLRVSYSVHLTDIFCVSPFVENLLERRDTTSVFILPKISSCASVRCLEIVGRSSVFDKRKYRLLTWNCIELI